MLHANVVWHLYQHLEKIGRSKSSVLIHVYESYMEIMDAPILTLTRAFFVPRLITINAWYEQSCDHCGISYIGPLDNGRLVPPVRNTLSVVVAVVELPLRIVLPAGGKRFVWMP